MTHGHTTEELNPGLRENQRQYRQSLGEQVSTIEQEARMVLPGIQALFGFQLIAVFNQSFHETLSKGEQVIHLLALIMVAVSAVLVVAPAAYHRQANHQISAHFVRLSSRFLAWAMLPLAIGTCLDIYLVTRMILDSPGYSLLIALLVSSIFTWTWFILPRAHARQIRELPSHNLVSEEKKP